MKWPRCHDSPGKIMAEFKPGSNRKPLRSERSFNILGVPRSVLKSGRSGGMADALDSKSGPRKWVWVQVPPSAVKIDIVTKPIGDHCHSRTRLELGGNSQGVGYSAVGKNGYGRGFAYGFHGFSHHIRDGGKSSQGAEL